MKVARLEVFGFKSFFNRLVLNFDHNVISIVGPNGCGKSNVVDALKWILGETQAKQLRGGVFEDLIFNGSDSKRPLGMAEVSITFANRSNQNTEQSASNNPGNLRLVQSTSPESRVKDIREIDDILKESYLEFENVANTLEDGASDGFKVSPIKPQRKENTFTGLPEFFESAEIQLTRRVYRSGESEFFINKTPCCLRDLLDLYKYLGLGARGLSIVGQGQVGQFIAKKPVERRELLEEAAGIVGFRAKIESAMQKLAHSNENILRLIDLISEVDKQVRSLKRQAERAHRRQGLKEELKQLEIYNYSLRCLLEVLLQQEVALEIASYQERIEESKQQISSIETELTADQEQEESENQKLLNYFQQQQQYSEVISKYTKLETESLHQLNSLEGKLKVSSSSQQKILTQENNLNNDKEIATKRKVQLATNIEPVFQKKSDLEKSLLEVKEKFNQEFIEKRINEELENLSSSSHVKDEESNARLSKIASISFEIRELSSTLEEIRKKEEELRNSNQGIEQKRNELHQKQLEYKAVSAELNSLESQLSAIAEHSYQALGVNLHSKQSSSDTSEKNEQLGQALLSYLEVPAEYQKSVSAFLGDRINYPIVEDAQALLANYSRHNDKATTSSNSAKAKKQFGIISTSHNNTKNYQEIYSEFLKLVPSCKMASSIVGSTEKYISTVKSLLGGVFIVDTIEEALELRKFLETQEGVNEIIVITKNSEIFCSWGCYSSSGEGLSLSFLPRINELKTKIELLQNAIATKEEELSSLKTTHERLLGELKEIQDKRNHLSSLEKTLSNLNREQSEFEKNKIQIRHQIEKKIHEQSVTEERLIYQELSKVTRELTNLENSLQNEGQHIFRLENSLLVLKQEKEKTSNEMIALKEIFDKATEDHQKLVNSQEYLDAQASRLKLEDISLEVSIIETEKNNLKKLISEKYKKIEYLKGELYKFQHEIDKAELKIEKINIEKSVHKEDLERKYGDALALRELELENVQLENKPELLEKSTKTQQQISQLASQLERESEVDPESIEKFDVESKRLIELQTSLKDLQAAARILENGIEQVKTISKEKFLFTFTQVQEKFSEIIPKLFGGGSGELFLLDSSDPLNSGIEINLRPPGKKITTLDLMSGGEKALVSTAVMLSVFLHKPSPICVLDEVDAPLDEANLERFLNLIKEISDRVQFLIITHNKQTMTMADKLVGITMQEPGISTALTVTLEDVEQNILPLVMNG